MIHLKKLLCFVISVKVLCVFAVAPENETYEATKKMIVQTTAGLVQGEQMYPEKTWYRFRGIPFAEPPVGSLRFEVCIDVF